MNVSNISDVTAEAGVVASVVLNPELIFHSEHLKPNHFTDPTNAYLYYAVGELAKKGIEKVDSYNIFNQLNSNQIAKRAVESLQSFEGIITIQAINDFIEVAPSIARTDVNDYMALVNSILDSAFRRKAYAKLAECQTLCFNTEVNDIEQKIYGMLDDVMLEFASKSEVPKYRDVVDDMWAEIVSRQGSDGVSGIPFKFKTLNVYCTIEPGELFVVAAEAKQGKSMFLLNCAADLLRKGYKVLYIDSELNTRLFTCRLISHLTNIEYRRVKTGRYSKEEEARIKDAIEWLKTREFVHMYMPVFDSNSMYTIVKKIHHTMGIDVLVIDYFKSTGDGDAFATYAELGRLVD